jgi:hypothetical protein
MAAGGGDRGRVAGIALGSMVQVGWFIEVSPLGMQEYIHIGEITIETICGVDIDGIIAGYLIMSFVVIGKVGTTEGIGETTGTGVLKADTIKADEIYDKTKWSVVTRDKTKDKTRGKTKWSVVTRDKTKDKTRNKTRDKIDKVREWSDIKVVLNSNLLLVVTEIKAIRTT